MHRGCTFLIRKVQDTSARLTDVRPSTQVALGVRLGRAPTTTSASEASTRRRRCPR